MAAFEEACLVNNSTTLQLFGLMGRRAPTPIEVAVPVVTDHASQEMLLRWCLPTISVSE